MKFEENAWLTSSSASINSCSALLTDGLFSEIRKLLDLSVQGLILWSLSTVDVEVLPERCSCKECDQLWCAEGLFRFPSSELDLEIVEGVIPAWDEKDKFLGLVCAWTKWHSFLSHRNQSANNTPFRWQKGNKELQTSRYKNSKQALYMTISASPLQGGST